MSNHKFTPKTRRCEICNVVDVNGKILGSGYSYKSLKAEIRADAVEYECNLTNRHSEVWRWYDKDHYYDEEANYYHKILYGKTMEEEDIEEDEDEDPNIEYDYGDEHELWFESFQNNLL